MPVLQACAGRLTGQRASGLSRLRKDMTETQQAAENGGASKIDPSGCSIYAGTQEGALRQAFVFELKSCLGRWFLNRRPPVVPGGAPLLNFGCGTRIHPEFVNADFFRLRRSDRAPNFWGIDLRHPLNCADAYWAGVFSEHTLEHLTPERVRALLAEIFRTLQPRAWVRLVVPDLAKYVAYYEGRPSDGMFQRWQPRGAALRSVAQNHLHQSLWDAEMLSDCLTQCGFEAVTVRSFGCGADVRLLLDTPERAYESLYLEGQKPPL